MNLYQQARFALSVNHQKQLPHDARCEVAFAGRSNAGKSSALNTLTAQKALARVSKTPGRTQLINYFALPQTGDYLVDLPGYGYADVPPSIKAHWEKLLTSYLMERKALCGVVLLMDIRHPLKDLDMAMLECCAARGLPVCVLLTKCDKLSRSAQLSQIKLVQSALEDFPSDVQIQVFSSLKKTGLAELVGWLDGVFLEHLVGEDDGI